MISYCVHCGSALKTDSKFCSKCGKVVEEKKVIKRERPLPSRKEISNMK